ncbi:putative alkaline phosphatase [Mycolicibacterium hassiacum DSM 44199]|uniref:Putative alkaline phosphatase n=1 Tax=Mycolicibacterium hassiacum (strain DSM 44199 / CIP 105218 / JCM 12690 / 3849) TaxID=1122247 RepID=K5BEZ0_MYCHD|nr:putative alkaline phosphatase [Mycolicibacterium hassiacum DSM 44199]MDA4087706.1 hypothetical protein [Mycolicibacterium hassiacum DSM 44199]
MGFDLPDAERYHRLATYPVYLNAADPREETVAEISAVTPDGNTVIYTDAAARRIGFLDIRHPANPVGRGTLSLAELGHADDQPTSVAAVGEYVLVVIDSTGGDFAHPAGRVDVVRVADRSRVRSIDLGGQPDSIAVSPDGSFAAVAIENQRDEEAAPPGGEEGDLPQPPTGFVQLIDLVGAPQSWTTRRVEFEVEAARAAGLDTPEDLEPEFVSINSRGQVAVTLQENNGIAIIDGRSGAVSKIFSAGSTSVAGVDTVDDGVIDQGGSIPETPREPDAVGWIGDDHLATANEGDWKGGAPAAGRSSTPAAAKSYGTQATPSNNSRCAPVCTSKNAPTRKGPSRKGWRSPNSPGGRSCCWPPSAAISSPSTTSAMSPRRCSARSCPPRRDRRGSCLSRRVTCW